VSVLDRLTAAPGVYWGEGQGPGGSRFVARVALQQQADSTLTLDYEAWSPTGGLQHAESARLARTDGTVTLAATSNGGDDVMLFREGETGVFGSVGAQRVGLVISSQEQRLTFSWWWTGRDGELREQSRAVVAPMRQIVPAPPVPGAELIPEEPESPQEPEASPASESSDQDELVGLDSSPEAATDLTDEPDEPDERVEPPADAALAALAALAELEELGGDLDHLGPDDLDDAGDQPKSQDSPAAEKEEAAEVRAEATPDQQQPGTDGPSTVPWPGILVLHGSGTGLVAQRLAARLTRAAVVRTDLFDRAVRGTAGRPDPALRQRIAVSVVQGYAATGHPVILHGASTRSEHEDLVAAISGSGLAPVQLVEIAEGEDYGEVARRLIESD
jgi:hypothetical protein